MSVVHFLSELGTVITALLIVIDPLGVMPVVIGLMTAVDKHTAQRTIFRVVIGSTVLLLFFTITGTGVLRLFGITLSDMRIGGGLLLIIIALRLVVEGRFGPEHEFGHAMAVVPLITPLIIGPGAITAAVVLAAIHGVWMTALAGVITMLICLGLFLSARLVHRVVGDAGTDLASRVMGVFIATIAISYIRVGVLEFVKIAGSQ